MNRKTIATDKFNSDIFTIFHQSWMLLTGGDYETGKANTMTVSWGLMGTIWFKSVVMIGLRPQRYTLEFIEEFDTFTLAAFPDENKDILSYCGAHSGREYDKIKECGLTLIPSEKVSAPAFEEAELIIECRKLYCDELRGKNFIDKSIVGKCYDDRDFHKLFIAEVIHISGTDKFIRK